MQKKHNRKTPHSALRIGETQGSSPLNLQNAELLPFAIPGAALAAVTLAVPRILGTLLLGRLEEQATCAQGLGVVEQDVGLVFVHLAQDDDVRGVVLRSSVSIHVIP